MQMVDQTFGGGSVRRRGATIEDSSTAEQVRNREQSSWSGYVKPHHRVGSDSSEAVAGWGFAETVGGGAPATGTSPAAWLD